MRSIYDFFVRLPKAFNDEIQMGDTKLYIDPKWEEFKNRKMEGEVVAVPEKYKTRVKIGDTLFFHHHVVISGNGNGQTVQDDIYFVRFDANNGHASQDTGNIELISDWIFLEPEEQELEETTDSGIVVSIKEPEYNQYGYVLYDSPRVQELGLKKGDKVMIMKNADYEMEIDGQKVYRVHMDHIYATGF